jgi:hypothetical protein
MLLVSAGYMCVAIAGTNHDSGNVFKQTIGGDSLPIYPTCCEHQLPMGAWRLQEIQPALSLHNHL